MQIVFDHEAKSEFGIGRAQFLDKLIAHKQSTQKEKVIDGKEGVRNYHERKSLHKSCSFA